MSETQGSQVSSIQFKLSQEGSVLFLKKASMCWPTVSCSNRKPSWPSSVVITWKTLPGMPAWSCEEKEVEEVGEEGGEEEEEEEDEEETKAE